jgi:hypothetical protein
MCRRCAVRVRQFIPESLNVGFYYGAVLKDPAGLLEGSGKRMRHVKLKPGLELDTVALRELIDAAYLDIRARLVQNQR